MARNGSPKTAFNLLSRNFELIEQACYENNGDMPLGEDNASIEALVRNRLAYYIDDELCVRVHSKVRMLVDHVCSRFRFREKHGEFAALIDALEYALESFHRAKLKPHGDNYQLALDEVREVVLDLTELLSETVSMYNHFVLDDFTTAYDLDERIFQTQRCKNELVQINEIFMQLKVEQLLVWASSDPIVDNLLMKIFKRKLDRSLSELNIVNQKLIERLDKLHFEKQVQRRNLLLDSFAKKYKDKLQYPLSAKLVSFPPSLALAARQNVCAYADLATPKESYQETLAKLASQVKAKVQKQASPQEESPVAVVDVREEKLEVKIDLVMQYLGYLFEAVLSDDYKEDISAVACYKAFCAKEPLLAERIKLQDWLFLVMTESMHKKRMIRRHALYEEWGFYDEVFKDTALVGDIVFKKLR